MALEIYFKEIVGKGYQQNNTIHSQVNVHDFKTALTAFFNTYFLVK